MYIYKLLREKKVITVTTLFRVPVFNMNQKSENRFYKSKRKRLKTLDKNMFSITGGRGAVNLPYEKCKSTI